MRVILLVVSKCDVAEFFQQVFIVAEFFQQVFIFAEKIQQNQLSEYGLNESTTENNLLFIAAKMQYSLKLGENNEVISAKNGVFNKKEKLLKAKKMASADLE